MKSLESILVMSQINAMKIGLLSVIPRIKSQIIKRMPHLEPQITDRLEKTGISASHLLGLGLNSEDSREVAAKIEGDCKILVADPDLLAPIIQNLKHIQWIQSTWDGVDALMKVIPTGGPYPNIPVARLAMFGQHMAEYVLGHIISRERDFKGIFKDQQVHKWQTYRTYRLLNELSIGLIGMGEIGKHVAKIAKDFGMTVHGLVSKHVPESSRLPYIDRYYFSLQSLPDLLKECDYVCNTLPNTPNTNGALSNGILENCKGRQTIFINIGRGNVITESELLNALNLKWIEGAILDVFEEEPLPNTSLLWDMENVTITPHCSGLSRPGELACALEKNLKFFSEGRPLADVLDWSRGY